MATVIDAAFPVFFGTDGHPINGGFIYIGNPDLPPQTNQKAVYWDQALTIPASQPLRIIAGRVDRNGSPALLFTDGDYAIELQDANMNTIYTVNSTQASEWEDLQPGPGNGSYFSNGTAPINPFARLRGRQFTGLSSGHDGTSDDGSPNPTGSWLQSYSGAGSVNPVTHWDYVEDLARISSVSDFGIPVSGATRNNGVDGIAIAGFSNGEFATRAVWGGYFDAVRNNATAGNAIGVEVEVAQLPTTGSMGGMTPYRSFTSDMAITQQIGAGSDAAVFGRSYAVDVFTNYVGNGAAAWTGINFRFDALMREGMTDDRTVPGNAGYARALAMAHDQGLSWYSRDPESTAGTQQEAVRMYSTVDSSDIRYEAVFSDGAFSINEQESPGSSLFRVAYLANGDAFIQVNPATLGGAPSISPGGTNPNINLQLTAKGNGIVTTPNGTRTGLGAPTADYDLHVHGALGIAPGNSVTPANNGDVVIEATDNTTLTFKLRGTDGTVRSATLTLS